MGGAAEGKAVRRGNALQFPVREVLPGGKLGIHTEEVFLVP